MVKHVIMALHGQNAVVVKLTMNGHDKTCSSMQKKHGHLWSNMDILDIEFGIAIRAHDQNMVKHVFH